MGARPVDLILGSSVGRWRVDKLLGEGGFGVVYQVSDATGSYALKIEAVGEYEDAIQLIRMEASVMSALSNENSRHFCTIEDRGRTPQLNYVVMTLAGKSLRDICYSLPGRRLSMGTALGAGIQSLEALESLHLNGFLHRDIKPGNFLVGRPEQNELRTLFLVDFGLCRRFTTKNTRVLREPRQKVVLFRGTMRYASIAAHRRRELSRKDDVESWLYMLVELTTGALPWKHITDITGVGECKKSCRNEPTKSHFLEGCAPETKKLLTTIDSLKYYDMPPYHHMARLLRRAFHSTSSQEFPYDWEKAGGGVF